MPSTSAKRDTAASRGRRSACALTAAIVGLLAGGARAELLGTYSHRNGTVHLMTELCREPGAGQAAQQTVGGRERHGCWGVNRGANPVVTWGDGSELVLDGAKARLSRRKVGAPEERARPSPPPSLAVVSTPTPGPPAEVLRAGEQGSPTRSTAARRDFARPSWCPDARFPHERLLCTDAELAERDLRLASLWWPYRRTLSPGAEAWHKNDYFRRLKACGADKACIVSEQETQMRRYREGLPKVE